MSLAAWVRRWPSTTRRVFLLSLDRVPGPHAVDLDVQREAEQDPDQDDDSEHGTALERLMYDHGADDVRDDERFEVRAGCSGRDCSEEKPLSTSRLFFVSVAASRRNARNAPSPPMTMMQVPTVSTALTTSVIHSS